MLGQVKNILKGKTDKLQWGLHTKKEISSLVSGGLEENCD